MAKKDSVAESFLILREVLLAQLSACAVSLNRVCLLLKSISKLHFDLVAGRRRPFMLYFHTDMNEAENDGDVASQTAANNEQELAPGGIVGFSLDFVQNDC